jgi:hypothetical protein
MMISMVALSVGALGCDDETDSGGGGSAATTTTGAGGAGTGGAGTGGAGTGGGGTGGATTTSTSAGVSMCVMGCTTAADCCQGAANCPGDYPANWECNAGVCNMGQCSTDDQCTYGGVLPNNKCLTLDLAGKDYKVCAGSCAADADCSTGTACTGVAKNGTDKYCQSTAVAPKCTADADCNGSGKCNTTSGACYCDADAECTVAPMNKCASY